MIRHSARRVFSLRNRLNIFNNTQVSRRKFSFDTDSKIFKSTQRDIRGDASTDQHLDDILKIIRMVRDIRRGGHFIATLDPLTTGQKKEHEQTNNNNMNMNYNTKHKNSNNTNSARRISMPQDSPRLPSKSEDIAQVAEFFGLGHLPLDKAYYLGGEIRNKDKVDWTITELINFMNDCYCGNVGIEIQHIENAKERTWLQERVEGEFGFNKWSISSPAEQRYSYSKLLESDHTSKFLGEKYHFTKMFELEGAESLLPGLWALVHESSRLGGVAIEMGEWGEGRREGGGRSVWCCAVLSCDVI